MDDDKARTLPRNGMRAARHLDQPAPPNSDPLRRRCLPLSDEPQRPDSGTGQRNEGYMDDDDDDADAIHQNAVNMFKIAMGQAEMMELGGIDSSIEHLPVSTYDSWAAQWLPNEPVESFA